MHIMWNGPIQKAQTHTAKNKDIKQTQINKTSLEKEIFESKLNTVNICKLDLSLFQKQMLFKTLN